MFACPSIAFYMQNDEKKLQGEKMKKREKKKEEGRE